MTTSQKYERGAAGRAWKSLTQWVDHARADVVCVSYPKCGRTWLRVLLGKAITLRHGLDDQLVFDSRALSRRSGVAMPFFAHDSASNTEGRHFDQLDPDKSKYRRKRVLFLHRDPRDVVVSCYFQATHRKKLYEGTISDFIRDPHYGVRKILTFYDHWERSQDVPKAFHLVQYADLHERPEETLAAALRFLGEDVEAEAITSAIEFASFDAMKEMETSRYFKSRKLQPSNLADPESFKARKGVVGGYREYLDDGDCKFVEEQIAEFRCQFAG
jgi:hypothetical protein